MKIKYLITPTIGILLIIVFLYNFDLQSIIKIFSRINLIPAIIGFCLVALSTIACSFRWKNILDQKEVKYKITNLIKLNFESITLISLIPIGLAGVEAWRLTALYNINKKDFKTSAPTIVIDRLSGLWGLSLLSLFAVLFLYVSNHFLFINYYLTYFYILLLSLISLIPLINKISILIFSKIKFYTSFFQYMINIMSIRFFYKIFFYSIINQSLLVTSFWLCSISVGVEISFITVLSLGLALMLPAIIPFSFLGYGPREIGVVFILSFYFVPKEEALVISLIFGFLTTIQGIIGFPFFYKRIKLIFQNSIK